MADPPVKKSVVVEELYSHDDRGVSEFYERILRPYFRPDELETKESIVEGMREGRAKVLAARMPDGAFAGGGVCDWFARSKVLLLSYVAVPAEFRGSGIGAKLVEVMSTAWTAELGPRLRIGEVEDPRYYHDTAFGDAVARVRLYERLGARTLSLPYLQPALGGDGQRVPHLMLMVFGGIDAPPGTRRVDGGVVEDFLTEYFELSEGPARSDDADLQRLLAACRRPGGLPLLLVSELPGETERAGRPPVAAD